MVNDFYFLCDIQEVWKVSTTAGARRVKKGSSAHEASGSGGHSMKEFEGSFKSYVAPSTSANIQSSIHVDSIQVSFWTIFVNMILYLIYYYNAFG